MKLSILFILTCCTFGLKAQTKDSLTILDYSHAAFQKDHKLLYLSDQEIEKLKKQGFEIEKVGTNKYKWKNCQTEIVECEGVPKIYKYTNHDRLTSICISCIINEKVIKAGAFRAYAIR